ncbi:hypothetical protein JB92DRAFT_3034240 [Gautieria morchelliformis]|nr:hypothetical protein JB92DRAFT_3034240 [Gautieria morchelliformis]
MQLIGITLQFIHSDQECLSQAGLVSGAQMMMDTAMCALIVQVAVFFYRHEEYTIQTHSFGLISELLFMGLIVPDKFDGRELQ